MEEQDVLRAELALNKRKLEETVREVDTHKRKVTLSKADGKAEAQMEVIFLLFLFKRSFGLYYCRNS